jgi:hypothetical protein
VDRGPDLHLPRGPHGRGDPARKLRAPDDFAYSFRVGLSYEFGSIFNNVVNNRFNSRDFGRGDFDGDFDGGFE